MKCIFCDICEDRAKASIVARGDGWCAFLDARPVFHGHVLVVPTPPHVENLHELPPERVAPLFAAVQEIAGAVERGLGAEGTFVALNNTISQSVPHLHVHVVPRRKGDGLRGFFWPRVKYASDEERDQWAARIAAALDGR